MSDLKVTFVFEGKLNGQEVNSKAITLTAEGDIEPNDIKLDKVRLQIIGKLQIPDGWMFLKNNAEVADEGNYTVADILGDNNEIKIKLAAAPVYQGGPATYKLNFKFSDQDEIVTRQFVLAKKPSEATLTEIRGLVETPDSDLRKDKSPWQFKYLNAGPVPKGSEDDTKLTDVCDCSEKSEEGKTVFSATIDAVASKYSGQGQATYKLSFNFEGETKLYTSVFSMNVGPERALLSAIRTSVDTGDRSLRDDKVKWTFTFPEGGDVKDEGKTTLSHIATPEEITVSGITTFTATVKASIADSRGTWDPSKKITDVKLIEALKSGKAKEIPIKFPKLPDSDPIDKTIDFVAWHQIPADQKFSLARDVARIYNGFNMPDLAVEIEKTKPFDKINPKSVGLPQLQRFMISGKDYWILSPQTKANVSGANAQSHVEALTRSGYTRLAIEKQRNLAITTAASVTVPEYGSVEAEYSRAEAKATSSTEENLFLLDEKWVPKAEITLPYGSDGNIIFNDAGNNKGLAVNYDFARATDYANTADDLYQILQDWGTLIATKVTIGGASFFANVQKITSDFSEEQIKNAWNIKVQGSYSGVDVGVQNKGELTESQQRQFDSQYSDTVIKALGGDEELALNKQYGVWLGSLAKVDKWKPLMRDGVLPIYVVLDSYRKKRFARILAEGGEALWQKNTTCPSLKYTNFNWYISFGQQDTDNRLD